MSTRTGTSIQVATRKVAVATMVTLIGVCGLSGAGTPVAGAAGTRQGSSGTDTLGIVSNYADKSIISNPIGITTGPDGQLWFTNEGFGSLSSITTGGVFTNHPDSNPSSSGPWDIATGSDGALWFTGIVSDVIGTMTPSGVSNWFGTTSEVVGPTGITDGPDGQLWFTNAGGNSIGSITTAGVVSDYLDPSISEPLEIAVGPDGALWFTNYGNNSIGRVTTTGGVSNYTAASISEPDGITAGPDGALWFTNLGNNSIGRITTDGVVTNYHNANVSMPLGIAAGPDGGLWFTNSGDNSIGRITTRGAISTYTDPSIDDPDGITAGPDGAMWFTNYGNNNTDFGSIGRITTGPPVVPRTISSPVTANATVGTPFSFTVTTTGSPTPKITKEGKLPRHVRFVNNHNGTATLSGTPSQSGDDPIVIKAVFGRGAGNTVEQSFTLVVSSAPSDGRALRASHSP